jgi:chorismate dehydratase
MHRKIDRLNTVSLFPLRRLRIAAIDFLNPTPLMWDFEHDPEQSRLATRYDIHRTMPSECAAQLQSGEADIGLVPIASYATTPGLSIISGCTIASIDRVKSILLVVRRETGVDGVKTIAADTSSLTSLAYMQILFHRYWKTTPGFVAHAPDLDAMLGEHDAALLIGDPALLALKDEQARERRTGERLEYIDLAHEWRERTGTPWVSAFWAVRDAALNETGVNIESMVEDFVNSRDHGLAHIDDLAAEWTERISLSQEEIRLYLTENIHYRMDANCTAGTLRVECYRCLQRRSGCQVCGGD